MVGHQSTVNGAGVSCRAEFETLVTDRPSGAACSKSKLTAKHSLEDMVGDTRHHAW